MFNEAGHHNAVEVCIILAMEQRLSEDVANPGAPWLEGRIPRSRGVS